MFRVTVKKVGDPCGLDIVLLMNERKLMITRARFLNDGSFSFLVVDYKRPTDRSPEAVEDLKKRINPLLKMLQGTLEDRVYESLDGDYYCPECLELMAQINKSTVHCSECNAMILGIK